MSQSHADRVRSIIRDECIDGMRTGRVIAIDSGGTVMVDYHGNIRGPLPAKMAEAVRERLDKIHEPETRQVLLIFEEGDPAKPVIIDLISRHITPRELPPTEKEPAGTDPAVVIDGETIDFNAREQIVLRCGKASITLTRTGKVIIRGTYLLNRSSGVNRIKGGSVQIN